MSNEMYDVVVRHNIRTGKNDIYKIRTYKDLSKDEANELIAELKSNVKPKSFNLIESIKDFANENLIEDYPNCFHRALVSKIYEDYCEFCESNDYEPENKITFSKNICSSYGYKTFTQYFSEEEAYDCDIEAGTKRIYIKI